MRSKNKFKLILGWAILVLLALTLPIGQPYSAGPTTYYDKIIHLFLFGVWAYLWVAWLNGISPKQPGNYIYAFFVSIFYAGIGEYLQLFLPQRTTSEMDFMAGAAGAGLFLIVHYAAAKK